MPDDKAFRPDETDEFEASPQTEEAGVDLESALKAYEVALDMLLREYSDLHQNARATVEIREDQSLWDGLVFLLRLIFGIFLLLWGILRGIWFIIEETADDIRALINPKVARREATEASVEARRMQTILLEVLWSRDYLQYILEQPEPVPYHVKRNTLKFLLENDNRLDEARRRAVEDTDINFVKLRNGQPTLPPAEAWWWYTDNRRTRRARRLNAFWFIAAVFPALAAIVIITLLIQRLSVGGFNILSGASFIGEIIIGGGAILSGREFLNSFLNDRSSGRSWQGEIAFILATILLVVTTGFYVLAPPLAANIYNWFGDRAIATGNAAEAELYLESAARLDPDPHAGNFAEVGCLYLTLGSPDNAQSVFEQVLEADSRLLLTRYHLAQIEIEQGNYEIALQLITDGLNLLDNTRDDIANGDEPFSPHIVNTTIADQVEYLLRLAFGQAYFGAGLETESFQPAKSNLGQAQRIFDGLQEEGKIAPPLRSFNLPCLADSDLSEFIASTEIDLLYFQAKTFDAICANESDAQAADNLWIEVLRYSPTSNSRQANFKAEAEVQSTKGSCLEFTGANVFGGG